LNSFLLLIPLVEGEGLGEGDKDILSLREKSSGSASGVGRDTTTYCSSCFRGEEGDLGCREETKATGFGFGYDEVAACCILSDLGLNWVEEST
jgi:hypothetical protein